MTERKTFEELVDLLNDFAANVPRPRERWRHYQGTNVVVLNRAFLEGTLEIVVVYRHATDHRDQVPFVRPLSEWHQPVEHEGRMVPRFRRV